MKYAVYNTTTGAIARVISCPAVDLDRQLQSGEAHLEVDAGDDASHYVASGALVAKLPKPSDNHVFDYSTKTWSDPRTLRQLKDAKWKALKIARDQDIAAPLPTAYGVFDADERASNNIAKAVILAQTLAAAGQPVAIDFTLADNTTTMLDAAKMVEVGLTLAGREQRVRGKGTALRAQVEAATAASQLQAINW